jgi:hypothetical protein
LGHKRTKQPSQRRVRLLAKPGPNWRVTEPTRKASMTKTLAAERNTTQRNHLRAKLVFHIGLFLRLLATLIAGAKLAALTSR